MIDEALQGAPADGALIFARGRMLFDWGRNQEARSCLLKAAEHGVQNSTLFLQIGWTCLWTSDAGSSERWMRKAIEAEPEGWLGHFGLGSSLRAQGKTEDAIASFARAITLAPENVQALLHLADCRLAQNRYKEAEIIARRAVDLDGRSVNAWTTLGIALISQDRFEEAIEAFEQAYQHNDPGGEIDWHLNLGICLRDSGRLDDALALYERRLPALPSIGANGHYAHALLAAGRLREGWTQYEFRWLQQPLLARRPPFRKPVWDGQDLRGRTILLRTEQGIGDVIQFVRYAPHVKALGARVIMEVRTGLGELVRAFSGIDEILEPNEPYPEFDYYIHLMSLPRVFGTELASVPKAVPYLRAEPERRAGWESRIGGDGKFRVGLVWAGDPDHLRDRYRSVPLALFGPLGEVEGVQFYSLQKGAAAGQLADGPHGMPIRDLADDLHDFADTAAVIEMLHLVICVDTSVAHLAGALGKPVWVLVPSPPDWRWMHGRSDSPWYPTMRLFRQTKQGEWTDVIERIRDALTEEVGPGATMTSCCTGASETTSTPGEPVLLPVEAPQHALRGLTGVAETAVGIVQYCPEQPFAGRSIEYYGEYLALQAALLGRLTKPGDVVISVGPGVGMHALSLAPTIGKEGHLFLLESRPFLAHVLSQNLFANTFANFTLVKRPLAGGPATPPPYDLGGRKNGATETSAPRETIDSLRLNALDWVTVSEADDPSDVLRGAGETLWRLRPKLFVAVQDMQIANRVATLVRDFGYQCWLVETPYFNPTNFNRRDTDIFRGRTALAVLAIPEESEVDGPLDGCTKMIH